MDNVNQFIELLGGWLTGGSQKLRDLLIKNADEHDEYKINTFFEKHLLSSSVIPGVERNVEDKVEVVTFKIAQNISLQFRALAEAEGKSVQDLVVCVIKDYVNKNYVEHLKQVINSLSQGDKEKILAELAKKSD